MHQPSPEFHIKENDYFGTLATVLDQVAQDLRKQKQRRHAARYSVFETTSPICSPNTASKKPAASSYDLTNPDRYPTLYSAFLNRGPRKIRDPNLTINPRPTTRNW